MKNKESATHEYKKDKAYTYNYKSKIKHTSSGANAIYGLGIIGALFYYLQHVASFWIGVIGVVKAILWPAFLLYKVYTMLHM